MSDLILWKDSWDNETKEREGIIPKDLCKFGIKPLDDAMPFIQKNELVVIGADSGAGKSSLIVDIALHNAMSKKRVAVFYLEGGDKEFMARIKFKLIVASIAKKVGKNQYFDYVTWKCNMITNPMFKEMEAMVSEQLKERLGDRLWVYEIEEGFKVSNLISSLYGFHSLEEWIGNNGKIDLDLIIIDHLQYFELTGKESEIQQTTGILRELKQLTDRYQVPVILVSHLRKKNKDRGLPGQEDFYGSSNIPKIATTAIMISSDKSKTDYSDKLYPTLIRFVKSRVGIRETYAIRVNYNLNIRRYEKEYTLHQILNDNQVSQEPIEYGKLPYWVTNKMEGWEYAKATKQ